MEVKYDPNLEFAQLAVEPTVMMQLSECAAGVWFDPNPEFDQLVVEPIVMMQPSENVAMAVFVD